MPLSLFELCQILHYLCTVRLAAYPPSHTATKRPPSDSHLATQPPHPMPPSRTKLYAKNGIICKKASALLSVLGGCVALLLCCSAALWLSLGGSAAPAPAAPAAPAALLPCCSAALPCQLFTGPPFRRWGPRLYSIPLMLSFEKNLWVYLRQTANRLRGISDTSPIRPFFWLLRQSNLLGGTLVHPINFRPLKSIFSNPALVPLLHIASTSFLATHDGAVQSVFSGIAVSKGRKA